MEAASLLPAMQSLESPQWHGAKWIGKWDVEEPVETDIKLVNGENYLYARLLVFNNTIPVEFIEIPVHDGYIKAEVLKEKLLAVQTISAPESLGKESPRVTVVVCTRNRVESLKLAIDSLLKMEYSNFEIIVVDNASRDRSTTDYVLELSDSRVIAIEESRPGLSVARNSGVIKAQGEIIAFTDDDVVVDPGWLTAIVKEFQKSDEVACVTGLVPSGEIRTATQSYFEDKVQWSKSLSHKTFSIDEPPKNVSLFPFNVGLYGTGANFALRRSAVLALGGFDEGLGVGSPTGGGEDIDMFVRILVGGYKLSFTPAAVVWHRHRDDISELLIQAKGYGKGLGAWLTKISLDKPLASLAFRQTLAALRHLGKLMLSNDGQQVKTPTLVRRAEVLALLSGPYSYWRSRLDNRHKAPLVDFTMKSDREEK